MDDKNMKKEIKELAGYVALLVVLLVIGIIASVWKSEGGLQVFNERQINDNLVRVTPGQDFAAGMLPLINFLVCIALLYKSVGLFFSILKRGNGRARVVASLVMFSPVLVPAILVPLYMAISGTVAGLADSKKVDAAFSSMDASYTYVCEVSDHGALACSGNTPGYTKIDPTAIPSLDQGVQMVSAGAEFVCALLDNSVVKCWGENYYGQLGTEQGIKNNKIITKPVEVAGLGPGVVKIASGSRFTCALLDSGEVKCWGQNYKGQLGDGTQVDSPSPLKVTELGKAIDIFANLSTACAINDDRTVDCWGEQNLENGLSDITTLAIGQTDICGINAAHEILCQNTYSAETYKPDGVAADDGHFISIDATTSNSYARMCAITEAGKVICWGIYASGMTDFAQSWTGNFSETLTAIAMGDGHACVLTKAGRIKCWTFGDPYQLDDLGNNSSTYFEETPTELIWRVFPE
jgi:hypothetical protein